MACDETNVILLAQDDPVSILWKVNEFFFFSFKMKANKNLSKSTFSDRQFRLFFVDKFVNFITPKNCGLLEKQCCLCPFIPQVNVEQTKSNQILPSELSYPLFFCQAASISHPRALSLFLFTPLKLRKLGISSCFLLISLDFRLVTRSKLFIYPFFKIVHRLLGLNHTVTQNLVYVF